MTSHAATVPGRAAAHDEGMSRGMAGMAFFIASEIMLFGGLFAGFFYVHNQADQWPPASVEQKIGVPLAAVLTGILVSSSLTAHFGLLGLKAGDRRRFKLFLGLTILLGTAFIGGQIYEWFHLMDEGLTARSDVYGSTFFVITGFHGAHVIAGLCLLAVVLVRAWWNDFTPARHLIADASVLYWHFVDVVWVFVFSILYILAPL